MKLKNEDSNNDNHSNVILEKTTKYNSGIYETGLLWKNENVKLPNNFAMALKRLLYIEQKMRQDPIFREKYENNIMDYIRKGYARKMSEEEIKEFLFIIQTSLKSLELCLMLLQNIMEYL